MTDIGPFTLENPTFQAFLLYSAIVLVKMMFVVVWTIVQRFSNKTFISPEDAGTNDPEKIKRILKPVEAVERVRRCHMNDMENVYMFVLLGLIYVATSPEYATALLVFRVFAVSRVLHTIAYTATIPQPARAITFFSGFGACAYMGYAVLRSVL